jgi:glyoxylase-like metal-dependent hydrolase (beta-lactamase superfamily II)
MRSQQNLALLLVLFSFGYQGCRHRAAATTGAMPKPAATEHSQVAVAKTLERERIGLDLYVSQLAEGAFLVTHEFPWPGNSLVVEMRNSDRVIVGSPYTPSAMADLLNWFDAHRGRRKTVAINTGYHVDNLGGNSALIERNIPVYGSDLTARLLAERGEQTRALTLSMLGTKPGDRFYDAHATIQFVAPTHLFPAAEGLALTLGDERVVVYYPGPSQAPDKVVVYFPSKRILFGGCAVIARDRLGNTAEANFDEWTRAMHKLESFDTTIVVPGHGDRTDPALIQHTVELLAASSRQSR